MGRGAIYQARDPRLDRTVAIRPSKAQFSERLDRDGQGFVVSTTQREAAPISIVLNWPALFGAASTL